jgi:hypothetical protein
MKYKPGYDATVLADPSIPMVDIQTPIYLQESNLSIRVHINDQYVSAFDLADKAIGLKGKAKKAIRSDLFQWYQKANKIDPSIEWIDVKKLLR